jgi:lysophospholipase L1-like esterase
LASLFCIVLLLGCAIAQDTAAVPQLVKFSGTISGAPAGTVGVIFALYKDQTGGAPLWQEVQNITVDASGRYSSLLGARSATGIPLELFANNEARWLGVEPEGQPEMPRVLLVSVPYALKASDSETLGGLPASAFLRADAVTVPSSSTAPAAYINTAAVNSAANRAVAAVAASGATAGHLPVFTDASGDLGNSLIAQSGNFVGIGTAAPAATLDIVGTNPSLRIDNYSNTAGDSPNFNFLTARGTSSVPLATQSGDNLGQFASAGYNGAAFPGSKVKVGFLAAENWNTTANGTAISFETTRNGTTARAERMRIDNTGNVGIGTTTPAYPLSVNGVVQSLSGGFLFPDGSTQATALTVPLPVAMGGTGSTTQSFVDLSSTQTINGAKTFDGTVQVGTTGSTTIIPGTGVSTPTVSIAGASAGSYVRADGTGFGTPAGTSPSELVLPVTETTLTVPLAPAARADQNFVFIGDSLTAGYPLTPAYSYPVQAGALPFFFNRGTSYTTGETGGYCTTLLTTYPTTTHPYRPAGSITRSYVFIECGHNDLVSEAQTDTAVFATLQAIYSKAHADGFIVVAFTVPKATTCAPSAESYRQALNDRIRGANIQQQGAAGWDYLIDFDWLFTDPTNELWFQPGGVHLTAAGYSVLARYVNQVMMTGGGLNVAQVGNASQTSEIRGWCAGTAISSTTISPFGFGQGTTTSCTGEPNNVGGFLATHNGILQHLYISAGTGGVNPSSGLCIVTDNGSPTALRCTLGTASACSDILDSASATAGHLYKLACTTQEAETLGDLNVSVEFQ